MLSKNILNKIRSNIAGRCIAIIGMPGCGKSTIGKVIAKRYGLNFIDTDSLISESEGMSINEIFGRYGEERFRDLETECIRRVSEYKSFVISTGGGSVLREENMALLKKNSFVIFIDRSPEDIIKDIDAGKRPLLKNNPDRIFEIYSNRIELYRRHADYIIENKGDLSGVIEIIDQKLLEAVV